MEIVIRRGTAEDGGAIASIQRESGQASQWAPGDYAAYELRVAECESRMAGFLVSRPIAKDEYEVLNIAVAWAFRRRGVGRALMEAAMSASPGAWFLEVRESNHAARELYLRLGFEQAGIRRDYYLSPIEDAVVMTFFS